jgi:histone H3/H4
LVSCHNHVVTDRSGSETEALPPFRRSMSEPVDDGLFVPDPTFPDDENTFRLEFDRELPIIESPQEAINGDNSDAFGIAAEAVLSDSFQQHSTPALGSPDAITRQMTKIEAAVPSRPPRRKKLKLTKRGNVVPALPSSLVKRTAIDSVTRTGRKRPTIDRESLTALEQATEWFFEQIGEDLEAYSDHAKRRKRIDETDVLTLMRRQRVIGRGQSLQELAQKFLPDEALADLDLPEED